MRAGGETLGLSLLPSDTLVFPVKLKGFDVWLPRRALKALSYARIRGDVIHILDIMACIFILTMFGHSSQV